jgi:hypothetical protein
MLLLVRDASRIRMAVYFGNEVGSMSALRKCLDIKLF